ncbi:bacteriohemerythrin [Thermomonas sp. XSG]|jgi:hemerythrin|uniref:bacteriohemerythrin n=1 Tax=Thermomonas sp. XSG TaxID=2771436 RepID=UPI001681AC88|nr:bacteriohemerythrin [Thermomonas sp. XSG]QNU15161.1 bacteriohemerythrin [Thermomonas sp. XSG]
MALLVWQAELDTGIDVIDQQHHRIVALINQLAEATTRDDQAAVLEELVDYTLSHFAFEEELMEESGYTFGPAHKRVHEMFVRRVSEYRMRFDAGEDITGELKGMLARWLFNHIRGDDKSYARHVRHYLDTYKRPGQGGANDGWFKRRIKAWLQ